MGSRMRTLAAYLGAMSGAVFFLAMAFETTGHADVAGVPALDLTTP